MPQTAPTKSYDWTYTTVYSGSPLDPFEDESPSSSSANVWGPADPEESSQRIPLAELSRPDPILFYAEVPLFEDELHDNGSSNLLVRIVRMFFILQNYTPNTQAPESDAYLHFHSGEVYPTR
jgi:type 2A phosphatase activator TIP41